MNKTKLLASAQKYMRKGQYKKAIAEYEKVLKEDPEDVRARLNLANLYYRQKDQNKAVDTFLEVANIYEAGGFTLKAIAVYKQILKIVPDRENLYVRLASNYQQHGLLNEAAAQYREALRLLDASGDQLGKLNVIRQILELDPDNYPDRLRLAEAFSALGQIRESVVEFRKVAEALERQGYSDDFQRTAERLLYHQPDDAVMAKKLAASYTAAGEPQRALPKIKVAYRSAPRDLEVLGILADTFSQLGQSHKAVTVLKEMARLYDKSGLETERDDCYQEILALNPDDEQSKKALGQTVDNSEAGTTIEFDELSDADMAGPETSSDGFGPGPAPTPASQRGKQRTGEQRVLKSTGVMSPAQAAKALRESMKLEVPEGTEVSGGAFGEPDAAPEFEEFDDLEIIEEIDGDELLLDDADIEELPEAAAAPAAPRGRASRVVVETDEVALAAEALIDQMLREAVEEEGVGEPEPEAAGSAESDLEALFEAALDDMDDASETVVAPTPVVPAPAPEPAKVEPEPARYDEDFSFSLDGLEDDDDDDEVGFGAVAEQTIVDNAFIPEDVLSQVQSGVGGLVIPGSEAAAGGGETFDDSEDLLKEELQELDFYIANGLADEARLLLTELQDRYANHPYVKRRADSIQRM